MSKSSKRFRILFTLVLICLVVSMILVACNEKKFTVTYDYGDGRENLVRPIIDGSVVEPSKPEREGYDFVHWVKQGEETAFDFTSSVKENLVLVAVWSKQEPKTVRLNWNESETATYVFDGLIKPPTAKVGDTVTFSVKPSVFYKGTPVVTVGATALTPVNGKYSFVVEEEVTIDISGLEKDSTPILGTGTELHPYILTVPAHIKTIADSVNNNDDTTYNTAYIKLGADIDLQGEIINPIGVDLYYNQMFRGVFDGDGKTVKNFSVSPNAGAALGLFGFIEKAVVKNLNVENNLEMNLSATLNGQKYSRYVGGIVGYSIGSDIVNCRFSGSLHLVNGVDTTVTYAAAGGIAGYVQGEGSSILDSYTATVSYSSVNATISAGGNSYMTALGGIAGVSSGISIHSPSNIYNNRADVEISGNTNRAGGVVGWMRERSSIDNCFVSCKIDTVSDDKELADAKGSIVGESFNETSVMYSAAFADKYNLIGLKRNEGYQNKGECETLLLGNVSKAYADKDISNLSALLTEMDWSGEEWNLTGTDVVPNFGGSDKVLLKTKFFFETTFNEHDEAEYAEIVDNNPEYMYGYLPLTLVFDGDGLNTLTADNGEISYGYFLDPEHTVRIPASFLITGHRINVYVGFADYSEVQGTYHTVIGVHDVTLEFDDNGKMTMYADGMKAYYMYVYDGEGMTIHDAYFVYLKYDSTAKGYDVYSNFFVKIEDGGLTIYDGLYFRENDSDFPPIKAIKDNGVLGTWYTGGGDNDVTYTFRADGSGLISDGRTFTYTIVGKNLTITYGDTAQSINAFISDSVIETADGATLRITKPDEFFGRWEGDYNKSFNVYFDGSGNVRIGDFNSTYEIDGNGVLTADGIEAHFNENGLLVLNYGGVERILGREHSYIGIWNENALGYTMILNGINKDGYGAGRDSRGYDFTYVYSDGAVILYFRTALYGMGDVREDLVDKNTGKPVDTQLWFAVYTPNNGMMVDDYNLTYTDSLYGTWNSSNGITLEFNGDGGYEIRDVNMPSLGVKWNVFGQVTVTENGEKTTVDYKFERATESAKFTYKEVEYTVAVGLNGLTVTGGVLGGVYSHPDELFENSWHIDGVFKKMEFDGRGKIGCGKVKITTSSTVTYDYEIIANKAFIISPVSTVYEIDLTTKEVLDGAGAKIGTLGMYSSILGKKYAVYGLERDIDARTLLDKDGIADGKLGEIPVKFVYVTDDILSITDAESGALSYYLVYQDGNVLMAEIENGEFVTRTVLYVPDELRGVYYNADKSVKLTLDGASGNTLVDATAVWVPIDAKGKPTDDETEYIYKYEEGEYRVYAIDEDTEDEILAYTVSTVEVIGGVRFETADGKVIYLKEA